MRHFLAEYNYCGTRKKNLEKRVKKIVGQQLKRVKSFSGVIIGHYDDSVIHAIGNLVDVKDVARH